MLHPPVELFARQSGTRQLVTRQSVTRQSATRQSATRQSVTRQAVTWTRFERRSTQVWAIPPPSPPSPIATASGSFPASTAAHLPTVHCQMYRRTVRSTVKSTVVQVDVEKGVQVYGQMYSLWLIPRLHDRTSANQGPNADSHGCCVSAGVDGAIRSWCSYRCVVHIRHKCVSEMSECERNE